MTFALEVLLDGGGIGSEVVEVGKRRKLLRRVGHPLKTVRNAMIPSFSFGVAIT